MSDLRHALELIRRAATTPADLDSIDEVGPRLESYVRDTWAPAMTRTVQAGYLYDLRSFTLAGLPAASAFQPYEDETGAKVAQLVVIRGQEHVFRFRSIAPAEDIDVSFLMEDALASFRMIPATESARFRPYWIEVHRIRPGDSVNLFAAAMPMRDGAEARFRRLNGLRERDLAIVGNLVKLVMQ